ncbi:EAL domain-containing protein [Halomonas sp. YLGW01]|uniref:bifunctional diguanylate cyclase/phosphodiesterase n=1 Tax=Halomonas sp. YLGW01 TaxID=2773308 RepID=UPI001F5B6600|nr:EAL domain-containing protein [Halomonas sp. YLGW01]
MLDEQQDIHEMIAYQAPLEEVLEAITSWVNRRIHGALVSIMRYTPERNTLNMVANAQFSARYQRTLQDVGIGDGVGTCGTAAFLRQMVITEDIMTDSRWEVFRAAARLEGLRACWSMPILTKEGQLLGTFATYYRHPSAPSPACQDTLRKAASLVALAIVRDQDAQELNHLKAWHTSLFTNHPDGVYKLGLDGRLQQTNAALERLTGYAEDDLMGRHYTELLDVSSHEVAEAAFESTLTGASQQQEMLGRSATGQTRQLSVTTFPVTSDDNIVGMYAICHDITLRKRQAASLELLERGIEASPVGMIMADARQPDTPIVYANEAFCQITGYTHDQVLGKNCRFLQGKDTDPSSLEQVRTALANHHDVEVTLRNYRSDGTPFWNRLRISPVLDTDGQCSHFIGTQEDITQQRRQEAQIAYQATHDQLTGLPNRSALESHLTEAFHDHQEQRQGLLALIYLDLDGLRGINDALGHFIGNRLLVAVANRLRKLLGPNDILARITGDEFTVLIPDIEDYPAISAIMEKILRQFDVPFEIDEHILYMSASLGVSYTSDSIHSAHQLLQRADLAMVEAKSQGRHTWQWYTPRAEKNSRARMLLRHQLQLALHHNQLEIHYQPVVDAGSGKVRCNEALLRWHHPQHGMISPGVFIPLAEETGQIIALGSWVLRQACQSLVDRLSRGERVAPVAVNISSLQFHRDGFLSDVSSILEETSLPAELLELEITESVLMKGGTQAVDLIGELRALGITIALDDFGTGFSSLSYLRDLPIDKVKLDRAFIQDILNSPRNAAIVQGVITMAHHIGLTVVAEGIETHEQQQDLIRRECDLLQGFYFAKPMPLDALQALPDTLPHRSSTIDRHRPEPIRG